MDCVALHSDSGMGASEQLSLQLMAVCSLPVRWLQGLLAHVGPGRLGLGQLHKRASGNRSDIAGQRRQRLAAVRAMV